MPAFDKRQLTDWWVHRRGSSTVREADFAWTPPDADVPAGAWQTSPERPLAIVTGGNRPGGRHGWKR
ncbi:hypothetical protein Pen02_22920 [Plantactinospora endophytica]|uniref:Uncharacterized protein n=1 Tax=Plantactinospora endophytica TaxID=673535 RepID=A0ABQ4DY35_9ACTN|nr:hypothetical protein Pen02_22920 [Plantactinospora endophytica]